MSREEAERVRALLRGTKAADLNDPFARQRVGRAIAQAIYRGPPKLSSRDTINAGTPSFGPLGEDE